MEKQQNIVQKMVVVGSCGVGKSALTLQFFQGHYCSGYNPTIEDSYRKQITVEGKSVLLDILDTAGQIEYSPMREQYLRTAQGFFLVFSLTNRVSFEEIRSFHQEILQIQGKSKVPIILVGNMVDLEADRKVSMNEIDYLVKKLNICKYIETSALKNINVDYLFTSLSQEIIQFNSNSKNENINQNERRKRTKRVLSDQCSIF